MKLIDLKGKEYGRLTVLARAENKKKQTMWKCECECGNITIVSSANLRSGTTKSCGCLSSRLSSERATKHGASYEPWYGQWKAMIRRTTNPKDIAFERYGGSGISIEPDFVNDPWAFYEEIGEFPGKGYTIERIDNSKGYFRGNIKWVTQAENNKNKNLYKNNKSGTSGITWDKKRKRWKVDKRFNGKSYYGGIHKTLKEAEKSLDAILKKIELGE